jgi:hypothetical protein
MPRPVSSKSIPFLQSSCHSTLCSPNIDTVIKYLAGKEPPLWDVSVCNCHVLCVAASGSGSVIGRDPLPPRAVSAVSLQQQVKDTPPPTITLTSEDSPQDHSAPNSLARKTSPSSGGMSHPSVPGSPNRAGNMERSDALDGQGKRVSVLHLFLSCNAASTRVSLSIFCSFLRWWN